MATVSTHSNAGADASIDPLAWLGEPGAAIAELAFGQAPRKVVAGHPTQSRHLALLASDTLELDLSDPLQRQFGDYELLELIGEGGMGVVYRARQQSLDREVAVKLLAAGPWASKEFVERFQREAQNAARMQHPNIVAIYEVGSIEELHFFSMRLIGGGNLAALLRREGPLAPMRAALLLRAIAEAVDYAHRLGVLHLDLKPANVLLDENATPHVADFGLARRLDGALASESDEVSGTPSYMAPEQATPRTARITTATDIWGLGAILYEIVTAHPPFLAENAQTTLKSVVEGALLAPRRYVPELSLDLEAIILKCLARDTHARYASARALADDLGRFVEGKAVAARPLGTPQRVARWARRQPYLAALTALLVISLFSGIVGVTSQWRRAESNAQLASTSAALANDRLWQARIDQAAIYLRDGHSYDALPGLAANIKEREAQALDAREDRIRIGNVERGAPRLIDVIALGSKIEGVAISPDGASIAVSTEDQQLRLIDTATGNERWQVSFKGASRFLPERFNIPIRLVMLRYSADGRHLVGRDFSDIPTAVSPTGYDEVLFDAADGSVIAPPGARSQKFRDATYSPDGAFAIVRSTDQRVVSMRTSDWQPLGGSQVLDKTNPAWLLTVGGRYAASMVPGFVHLKIQDPRTFAVLHTFDYAADHKVTAWTSSTDGGSIVVGHLDGLVERIDCLSGRSEILSPSPIGRVGWVTVSPDGRWLGAVADSGEVLIWDSSIGKLAAPMMYLGTAPENHSDQLLIDATARTVVASIDTQMGLWYLPDATSTPVRLSGKFPNAGTFALQSFAYDATQGLLATDGGQGELRLWRVQPLAPRSLHAAPMAPDQLHVDNGHLVAVEGDAARIVSADGTAIGPEFKLEQPPGFAEPTTDDKTLVVAAGPRLSVFDAATGSLRSPSINLPNDPASVTLSPDSRHALLRFADYENGTNRETGQIWDLATGTTTANEVVVEPSTHFRFSADGRSLLQWENDRVQVIDATTLQARWPAVAPSERLAQREQSSAHVPDAARPASIEIVDVQFSADASEVLVLTADAGLHLGASRLWRFDSATGTERTCSLLSETGGAESFAAVPDRLDLVVLRPESGPLWWDQTRGAMELPTSSRNEFRALGLAPDASMFASSPSMDSVALTSTRSRQWLSPPLPTALPTRDAFTEHVTHLAITRDSADVIGRTRQNEWLYWDVRPDLRPVDSIEREAALLNPDLTSVKNGLSARLKDSDRQLLRANDGGPPTHSGESRVNPILVRQPGLSDNLVDLGDAYNVSLSEIYNGPSRSTYHELTPGLHRFLGVDYDVRGAVVLSIRGFASEVNPRRPPPHEVRGIKLGVRRFAALDVLVSAAVTLVSKHGPYAIVEIDYRDGSRERLPILYGRDVVETWSDSDGKTGSPAARVAWRSRNVGTPSEYQSPSKMFAVHLVNPHPERDVLGLSLEATDEPWTVPWFFAITAELLSDATPAPRN